MCVFKQAKKMMSRALSMCLFPWTRVLNITYTDLKIDICVDKMIV